MATSIGFTKVSDIPDPRSCYSQITVTTAIDSETMARYPVVHMVKDETVPTNMRLYNGKTKTWSVVDLPIPGKPSDLQGVWANTVWLLTQGKLFRWDGKTWQDCTFGMANISAIAPSESNGNKVFANTAQGLCVLDVTKQAWQPVPVARSVAAQSHMAATAATLYATNGSRLLRFDAALGLWETMAGELPFLNTARALCCTDTAGKYVHCILASSETALVRYNVQHQHSVALSPIAVDGTDLSRQSYYDWRGIDVGGQNGEFIFLATSQALYQYQLGRPL